MNIMLRLVKLAILRQRIRRTRHRPLDPAARGSFTLTICACGSAWDSEVGCLAA